MSKNSYFKRSWAAVAAAALCVIPSLAGCSSDGGESAVDRLYGTPTVGKNLCLLDGAELDYDNMFFDDFTGGVDPDNWYIGKQAWGANGNGGVIPQNVNYTDDGILVLTGNGEYYTSGGVTGVGTRRDGTLCGAALISNFLTGAGRYEVKMKVLPRLGACNAFWTFAYDNDTGANHEIDIELPGGTHETGIISYERMLNTNYITETANQSQDTAIAETSGGKITNFVDGEWHTFGFDWYTLESGEDGTAIESGKINDENDVERGRVVYFVDGVVTAVSNAFVPALQTRIWLGVWFPNNPGFVGDARFESDNMYVDWVRYTPFADQPTIEFTPKLTGDVASLDEYPSAPITISSVNKVANGDFEYAIKDAKNSGWEYYKRTITDEERAAIRAEIVKENDGLTNPEINVLLNERLRAIRGVDATEYAHVAAEIGDTGSCGLRVDKIGLVSQSIDSIFEGFKLKFDFKAKGTGCFNIVFMGNGDDFIGECRVEINSPSAFKAFTETVTTPAGTKRIEIEITSLFDTPVFVDDVSAWM